MSPGDSPGCLLRLLLVWQMPRTIIFLAHKFPGGITVVVPFGQNKTWDISDICSIWPPKCLCNCSAIQKMCLARSSSSYRDLTWTRTSKIPSLSCHVQLLACLTLPGKTLMLEKRITRNLVWFFYPIFCSYLMRTCYPPTQIKMIPITWPKVFF